MTCATCGKEYSPACDYNQGRCPLHPPMWNFTPYHFRYLTLINTIKGWFSK